MLTFAAKRLVKSASNTRLWEALVSRMERRSAGPGLLRVLMYHRIDLPESRPWDYPGLISSSPAGFRQQMLFLAENYHVVTLDQVLAAADRSASPPEKAVLLTFDDATVDFAEHAWPVLKSLQLPATVFVPTAYPDDPQRHFWWNRLYRAVIHSPDGTRLSLVDKSVTLTTKSQRRQVFRAWKEQLKTLPDHILQSQLNQIVNAGGVPDPQTNGVLGWQQLQALHREGVTLAPHTHSHPMLNRLPIDSVRDELSTSRNVLCERLSRDAPSAVAYPAGGYNDAVVQAMTDLNFHLGFTTDRGVNSNLASSPHRLRRINVGSTTSLGLLRAQLANWGA